MKRATADFAGRPLMTGSCNVPYFAVATGAPGMATQYPIIGCSDGRHDCCPFDPSTDAVLTRCPQDHFTTAGGCCPIGFQIYYTAIGSQTPCYSDPLTKFIPASTPTVAGLTLITDHVFSQLYTVGKPATGHKKLPLGGIIGISVNAVLFLIVIVVVIWWIKRRRARRIAMQARSTTFPPEEPSLQMSRAPTTHELDSPDEGTRSAVMKSNWPPNFGAVSPPAYDVSKGRPMAATGKPIHPAPQELPGSTFIHEHHPAFTGPTPAGTDAPSELSPTSPPRTPTQSAVESEKKLPLSPNTSRTGTQSPQCVSPLASPKLPFVGG
ncbi:uncharacterized protein A1O9_05720 [Exophiala aquamarina CBS 119918]|uniref:Uncharacterized protein n=1 Tax=Exophiala aquamarina CBS 119918 TaxID=1182545 RepID=A0A072PQN7_9EURO|nr:uncharacterized protein A1O9_05720 [Exophiala aquamarina CBS 119918]KEF57800.1 hypothetical protein A1O9_05720 [Exophiala aquamarina CBS 119918]